MSDPRAEETTKTDTPPRISNDCSGCGELMLESEAYTRDGKKWHHACWCSATGRDPLPVLDPRDARIEDLEAEAVDQLNEEIWNLAILGDPQAADALVRLVAGSRAIATACELENAALWAFVRTCDDVLGWVIPGDRYDETRAALRQYEEKP
jgi:hypothetical protein